MENTIKKQVQYYYIYWALVGTWFASGILFFFNRKYLDLGYLGILDAVVFAIGLLANIPAGALADKFGRRKIVIIGVIVGGVGYSLWGFSVAGWMIVIGNLLYAIGISLQSGADEAMMYEYLKANGKEAVWQKVSATTNIIARTSFAIALCIGGIAYAYFDRLPFFLRGLTFFLMVIPLYKLSIIDKFQHTYKPEKVEESYWNHIKTGIRELFKTNILWVVPIYLLVQGMSYAVFTDGLLRPLLYEHTGLPIRYISAAIAVSVVFTVFALLILRKYAAKLNKPLAIFMLSLVCGIGFFVNLGNYLILSLIGLTLIQIATYVISPMLSVQVNKKINPKHRATALSTTTFMENALYVIADPIIGYMAAYGMLRQVIVGAVSIVFIGLVVSIVIYEALSKKNTKEL